jgi:hypothetical protein
MGKRTWLINVLGASAPLLDFIPFERMLQGESVLSADITKPFLVYRFGNKTSEDLAEDMPDVARQFLSIYLHDAPADYSRIDEMEMAVIHGLNLASSEEESVVTTRYLETSRDLDDQALGTIYRYVRFQLIMTG